MAEENPEKIIIIQKIHRHERELSATLLKKVSRGKGGMSSLRTHNPDIKGPRTGPNYGG